MRAYERLLRYVNYDTASDENSPTCPSTAKQLALGRALVRAVAGWRTELERSRAHGDHRLDAARRHRPEGRFVPLGRTGHAGEEQ